MGEAGLFILDSTSFLNSRSSKQSKSISKNMPCNIYSTRNVSHRTQIHVSPFSRVNKDTFSIWETSPILKLKENISLCFKIFPCVSRLSEHFLTPCVGLVT